MWKPFSLTYLLLVLLVSAKVTKDLYAMFDMSRSSFDKEAMRKKMKKILLKYHPDKNKAPDAQEKLLEFREAFEILEDDQKRAVYDRAGYEAAKNHGEGGGHGGHGHGGFGGFDPNDIFEKFFGGGRGGGFGGHHHQQQRRTPDSRVELRVSLEDAFQGRSHRVQFPRTKLCRKCKGVGAANPKDVTSCNSCAGTGSKTFYRQFGPGMVQQVRAQCDSCGGKGKTFKSKCPSCHGNKVERVNEELDIKIEPGAMDGHTIKFPKSADEAPGHETGDLFIVLGIEPNAQFRRDGANLYTKMNISLKEVIFASK